LRLLCVAFCKFVCVLRAYASRGADVLGAFSLDLSMSTLSAKYLRLC